LIGNVFSVSKHFPSIARTSVSIQALKFAFAELKANDLSSLATFFTGIKRIEFLECEIVPSSVLEAVESFKELGRIGLWPNHHDQACAGAAVLATCSATQRGQAQALEHFREPCKSCRQGLENCFLFL
jgi:hypothetical protein